MITAAITLAVGAAAGVVTTWWIAARRGDGEQVEIFRLRRHNADLRLVNQKLSAHCGHCGTARALPANRLTGGAL